MSYIGNSPGVASQRVQTSFTATANQTVFTPSAGYTLGYLDVYQNGVKLISGDDYVAADGLVFTLTSGALLGDSVEAIAYFPRGLSDGYIKAEADTLLATKAADNAVVKLTGDQTVAGVKTFGSNPILGAGVVNGVPYLNGSKALTSGSALVFDGTNFGVGTSSPLSVLNVNGTGGELIRISITADSGTLQEPALGFATGVTNTHPAAKISALEFDASDSRASLLFYTRGTNTDSAPTERVRIDSSGNFLTGGLTSYPGQADANSTASGAIVLNTKRELRWNNTNASIYGGSGGADDNLYYHSGNSHIWRVSGSEKARITSDGNFGVGSSNPTQRLHVNTSYGLNSGAPATSGTTQNGILRLTPNSAVYGETLDFGMNVGPTYAWIQSTNKDGLATNYPLVLNPNGGSVAIGTLTPWTKFQVTHSVNNTNSSATNISDYQNAAIVLHNQDEVGTGNKAGLFFAFAGNPGLLAGIDGFKESGTWNTGLRFYTNNQTGGNVGTIAERMRITPAGNFGIGTSNPTAKLEVKLAGDGDMFIGRYSGGNAKLVYAYQSSSDGFLELRTGADNTVTKLSGYNGTPSYFMSKVGINTTSPDEQLHVNGHIKADTAYLANGNARLHFYTYQIGTAYPYAHLKTSIPWENHVQMYSVGITGHEYGSSKPIDAQVVWYSYSPSNGVVSIGSSGTHTIELYRSTDGYIVIRVNLPSGYYTAFTVSQYMTNQGLAGFTILGSAGSGTTNYY
jgi:hypothetical protein